MPKQPDVPQLIPQEVLVSWDPDAPLELIYNATLSNGSLDPDLDVFGVGSLHPGHSELNNHELLFEFLAGGLFLSVKLPPLSAPPPSFVTSGVFATKWPTPKKVGALAGREGALAGLAFPLPFDTQLPFVLQGTYVAPKGPQDGTWAVGILARTGGAEDRTDNTKVVATLQFNSQSPGTARLNVPFGATSHTPVPLPTRFYDGITGLTPDGGFPNNPPQPFTLRLWIDRTSGTGAASLSAPWWADPLSTSFPLQDFLANSGPAITAVGTVIANNKAYDEFVSVHVQSFQIYATKGSPTSTVGTLKP